MNTEKSLEEQMRSWTPRRPSPRVAKQLFGVPASEARPPGESRTVTLPWYQTLGASLAGCASVLLIVVNFIHLEAIQHVSAPFGPMSNHMSSYAMAAPHNTWTAPILGWTNDGTVGSPIRPFDLLNTNRILR